MTVTDVPMMERLQEHATTDELGIEIGAFVFVLSGFILIKRDEHHGGNARDACANIVFFN